MTDFKRGGLRGRDGGPIPLRAVELRGEVIGDVAHFVLEQRYENAERVPLEAIYSFPLPSAATVTGFALRAADRRIDAVVKERDEAFACYDQALLSGHGAALLDRERPDVFTASVGNLLPGEAVTVQLEWVEQLHSVEGRLRIAIPTLVAPRYVPGSPIPGRTSHSLVEPTDRVPDADRVSPSPGAADYSLSLMLTLRLGSELIVSSPSHAIECAPAADGVVVTLQDDRVALDRDLVLLAESADAQGPATVVAHKQGPVGTFAITCLPDLLGASPARRGLDVVFVLDRSGSMGGAALQQARTALHLCLRQLREDDRFGVVAFDDAHQLLSEALLPFTQRTLEQADRWIDALNARGGTELAPPLLRALELLQAGAGSAAAARREACVVLLTDGQVANHDEIMKAILARPVQPHIHAFGVGTNVSDSLLRELARCSGGAVEWIHPGERIDEKVVSTFARAIAPAVRQLNVRFVDLGIEDQAPVELPPMVDGQPWTLFGRYQTASRGRIELRGTLAGEPWLLEIPVSLPATASAPALPRLWAAQRVQELERMELSGRRADAMKQRIVALATEYGIASRYTSFVAVETRSAERLAREPAQVRPVPVYAPAGWASFAQPSPRGVARWLPGSLPPASLPPASLPPAQPRPTPLQPSPVPLRPVPMMQAVSFRGDASIPAGFQPRADAVTPGAPPLARVRRSHALGFELGAGHDPIDLASALLCKQRACGLWADELGPLSALDAAIDRTRATVRSLLELLRLGVDASHLQHGPLVRKAIDALLPTVATIAQAAPELAELAFTAAWLSATGKRSRARIGDQMVSAGLTQLHARLGDERALRAACSLAL